MSDTKIMTDLEVLYQADYLKYQEFISRGLDIGKKEIVYITGLEANPYEEIIEGEYNLKEVLENIKHLVKKYMYLRNGEIYTRVTIYIDAKGVQKIQEEKVVTVDEILKDIDKTSLIGNIEEYIRLVTIKGKKDYVEKLKKQNEYFLQNFSRLSELKDNVNNDYQKELERLKAYEDNTEELEIDDSMFINEFDEDDE